MTTTEVKADAEVAKAGKKAEGGDPAEDLIGRLVAQARERGLELAGEGGLLQQLTKRVLESALEGEITDHLGYDKHDADAKTVTNSRNGRRSKTVTTDVGPVQIEVPRDREGSFEPKIVAKRQRRLSGVDEMVLSLSAKGLTHGEISAHLAEVYGASVSKQTISTITDKVLEGMAEWQNRPLDAVYPVIFLDAIHVKIRDGQVANRPVYAALAVTAEGTRDILRLWVGDCRSAGFTPTVYEGTVESIRAAADHVAAGRCLYCVPLLLHLRTPRHHLAPMLKRFLTTHRDGVL